MRVPDALSMSELCSRQQIEGGQIELLYGSDELHVTVGRGRNSVTVIYRISQQGNMYTYAYDGDIDGGPDIAATAVEIGDDDKLSGIECQWPGVDLDLGLVVYSCMLPPAVEVVNVLRGFSRAHDGGDAGLPFVTPDVYILRPGRPLFAPGSPGEVADP